MSKSYLFTSESVSEGHPDKICDLISDSVLDALLKHDPESRVAVETFTTTGLVVVGGEVTTKAYLDIQKIVRSTLKHIGYTKSEYGIDADHCAVLSSLHEQSPDISQGVTAGQGLYKEMGAGDQGMMFGFACKQTENYMPLPINLAHKLMAELARIRKAKEIKWLRPDSKAQVTVEYNGLEPVRVDTVVISTQHDPDTDYETIRKTIITEVIEKVIPEKYLDEDTKYFINPTGRFVIGGPYGDTGLTGRKIIVDTYGGWAKHGGGAFSGKDYTKVDRSAAYMTRYIAKNIVAADLADQIEIQVAYAIGVADPVSIRVDTRNTGVVEDKELIRIIKDCFDLTPAGIIKTLDLKNPIYHETSNYGHFGKEQLKWEQLDRVDELRKLVKK